MPPENARKPLVFGLLQGVQNCDIDVKCVKLK